MLNKLLLALIVLFALNGSLAQETNEYRFLVRGMDGNLYIFTYENAVLSAELVDIGEFIVTALAITDGLAVVYDDVVGQHLATYAVNGTFIRQIIETPTTSETGFSEWKHIDYAQNVVVASIDRGSNAGGVYLIDLTQSDDVELNYVTQGENPSLSPQADYIAIETFITYPNNLDLVIPLSSIAIHNLETGVQTVISSELQGTCRYPIWHPFDTSIVYVCWESNEMVIYQSNIVTAETRRLPISDASTCILWSPNGEQIAVFGTTQIHILDLQSTSLTQIPLPQMYQGISCLDWLA